MKLRIRGNSIRLRLTRSEVDQLVENGSVQERVEFGRGKSRFSYRLVADDGIDGPSAIYEMDEMTISISRTAADNWKNAETIGIESFQSLGDDSELRILIEKDFACQKTRVGENDSDAFPNSTIGTEC